jgi:hypothetical protein
MMVRVVTTPNIVSIWAIVLRSIFRGPKATTVPIANARALDVHGSSRRKRREGSTLENRAFPRRAPIRAGRDSGGRERA